jgi:hypothetical protein
MSESPKKVAKIDTPDEVVGEVEPAGDYFLAFDIERVGSAKKYGVLAVGTCFGTKGGIVIEKRAFCSKVPPPEGFDPSTFKFWSGFPEVLARIDAEAIDDHMAALHAYLLDLEVRFGPFGKGCKNKLRLVTDNPGYDAHWISEMFYQLFGDESKAISEMFTAYVATDDPSEQQRFLLPSERLFVDTFAEQSEHSHFPSDDAAQHYLRQCALERVCANRKKPPRNTPELYLLLGRLIDQSSVQDVLAALIETDSAMVEDIKKKGR